MTDATPRRQQRWLGPGVAGIGTASLLADVGHEVPPPATEPADRHPGRARRGPGDRGRRRRARRNSAAGRRLADRRGPTRALLEGIGLFALAYSGFAATGPSLALLAAGFVAAGLAIGCVETAEHAAVAALAPAELRGSAFGLLAVVQSLGNLAASGIAGLLWTQLSPRAAFNYLATWMAVSLMLLATIRRRPPGRG